MADRFVSGAPFINNVTAYNETEREDTDMLRSFQLGVSINWLVFYIVVYGMIFAGSIVGNQLVIWSFIIESKLRRPTNMFIVSLAVADFVTGLIAMSLGIVARLFTGTKVCLAWVRSFYYIPTFVLGAVTICNLLLITIDRYIAVTRPLKYPPILTKKKCKILIVIAWITGSFFGALPYLSAPPDPKLWVCGVTNYRSAVVGIQRLASAGLIPLTLLLLCLCYVSIFSVARKHITERRRLQNLDPDVSTGLPMMRTTVTTAIVLGAFTVCWLPSTAKFFIEIYIETTDEELFLIQTTSEVLVYGNSMIDPIIYGYRNELFRSTYKRIFHSLCQCFQRKATTMSRGQ